MLAIYTVCVDENIDRNYMSNKSLTHVLLSAGLTDKESSIYMAVLGQGPTTVLKISRAAGIKRTTVYSILESLKQKGLINIELKGIKQQFSAESPEKLSILLDGRKKVFELSLPELQALYNLRAGESFIKFYEGLEAIKSVYESLLKDVQSGDDYLVFADDEQWFKLDREYFQDFIERRAKLNIHIRSILQDTTEGQRHKKYERNYNERIKILPRETTLTTNLVIIPRRVVIQQLTPPVNAIVIETKSVIKMHRELFEIVWRSI